MPTQPTLMLSPCGTSLLTNLADSEQRSLLWKHANASEKSIPADDLQKMQQIIDQSRETLHEATFEEVCEHSAELHTIIRYYEMGKTINERDIHILLASDTWLGKQTAHLVQEWLHKHLRDVRVEERADLTTNNLMQFQSAMADLVKYVQEQIPEYRNQGYRVVFNLTGGFKSVQGFMQTLAMFYADEAIYIYKQSQEELLRLPSLPIQIDTEQEVRKNLATFRRLSKNLSVSADSIQSFPEMFYLEIDGEYALSPWGELIWSEAKKEIYSEKVWEPPIKQIRYSESFKNDIRSIDNERSKKINERMDDLVLMLEDDKNLKRLNFQKLQTNEVPGSTHEFYVFASRKKSRTFCHFEGRTLVLDRLGDHL